MDMDQDWLAKQFEGSRVHLGAVAYRMLGSQTEADDAVQETWLRLSRSTAAGVDNLTGWLTTVVARVCLDMLRSRRSRRESPLSPDLALVSSAPDPANQALLAESVGLALLVVLETLTPVERVAFVLHDMFGVSFDEIAPIVGRSSAAARQLASRARRRVQGVAPDSPAAPREVVDAFLAASHGGDFEALLALLDPEVVVRSDHAAAAMGAEAEVRGPEAVAAMFAERRAKAARLALVDGQPGLVWARRRRPQVVFVFATAAGKVTAIELMADPAHLGRMQLAFL